MPEYVLDHSLARETWAELDYFTRGYIEAAMWALTDHDGEPMDYLGLHDLHPDAIATMKADCLAFEGENYENFAETDGELAQHGRDFWLTRNRHGAGFWDRGYGEVGQRLTDAAHAYGECTLYCDLDGYVAIL